MLSFWKNGYGTMTSNQFKRGNFNFGRSQMSGGMESLTAKFSKWRSHECCPIRGTVRESRQPYSGYWKKKQKEQPASCLNKEDSARKPNQVKKPCKVRNMPGERWPISLETCWMR